MDFNFENAEIAKSTGGYLEPGNHIVKVTEVKKGESSQQHTPFLAVTVEDKDKNKCVQEYYLNTEVKEGKQQSAFSISSSALLTLVCAANNLTAEAAKVKLTGISIGNIEAKFAGLLVGKEFAIHLDGKWVNPTDTSKKPWVKANFGSYLFAVPTKDIDKLSKKQYIKGEPATATTLAEVDADPFA
jgi:hypothetical protein